MLTNYSPVKADVVSSLLAIEPTTEYVDKELISRVRLFKLTRDEFSHICGDERTFGICMKLMGMKKGQLRSLCKSIGVLFESESDSSSEIYRKIKKNEDSRMTLSKLPGEMREQIFAEYKRMIPLKLLDWIDLDKLQFDQLVKNPSEGMIELIENKFKKELKELSKVKNRKMSDILRSLNINPSNAAMDFLLKHPEYIIEDLLIGNKNVKSLRVLMHHKKLPLTADLSKCIHDEIFDKYLEKNGRYVNLGYLSENTNDRAIKIIESYRDKDYRTSEHGVISMVDWAKLSANPSNAAVRFLLNERNRLRNKIVWDWFCRNTNTEAVRFLIAHPININWENFYMNSNDLAVDYILRRENRRNIDENIFNQNSNDIDLNIYLNQNPNDKIIDWLIENKRNIDMEYLSYNANPRVIPLLLEKHSEICWSGLSSNPIIFEYKN